MTMIAAVDRPTIERRHDDEIENDRELRERKQGNQE
jgi:hypothetical protein